MDRAEKAALRAALTGLGYPFSARALALYRAINEALWERYRQGEIDQPFLALERFRLLLVSLGASPRGARVLGRVYLEALSRRGDVLPGCRSALDRLRRRYRLGLVTNGIDRVQRSRLQAARLTHRFEVVVTSERCGYAKPDPRILHVALEALGVAPREALYVGDDLRTDGGAARAAGVRFWWIDRGHPVPRGVRRPLPRSASLAALVEALDRA